MDNKKIMRLHHGPAVVLHCVIFAVVFVFFGGGGGGGGRRDLEYGLHNRAEKCFNHRMSQGKNLLHKLYIFTEQAMHYENLQLFLGNYNLKFGENG